MVLFHLAGELVHVEIVPPGVDFAVADLEGPHDGQLERLVREPEDVHPLGQHDWTIDRNVDDAELDALDAWRTRANEGRDRVGDVLSAGDRCQRDVVVDGVVAEKCSQLDSSDVVGPRRAEPPHHLDRALHLAPPAVELRGTARCTGFGDRSRAPRLNFCQPVREYSDCWARLKSWVASASL